jgi:SAM-dependent methyltransferase
MGVKDYFSEQSEVYAAFRPTYPDELYQFIYSFLKKKNTAWDCGTGNGQVASHLAKQFIHVFATDISGQQLRQAPIIPNITYSVSAAEKTDFNDHTFDLITVAQALHWFDRDKFYNEARRVLAPDGLLAVWGYSNLSISPSVNQHILSFYGNTVGPYWDNARKLVEQEYQTISFPFVEIPCPKFEIKVQWSLSTLAGYLTSWSATQKFIKTNSFNPVPAFVESLKDLWRDQEIKTVTFPVFLRLGKIK